MSMDWNYIANAEKDNFSAVLEEFLSTNEILEHTLISSSHSTKFSFVQDVVSRIISSQEEANTTNKQCKSV